LSKFVVHDGLGGRVVIHRAGCALLDGRYDDGGERHVCSSFAAAAAIAARLASETYQSCGWCRPEPAH
jgi:hypothetical protein